MLIDVLDTGPKRPALHRKECACMEALPSTQQNHVQYGSQPDGAKAAKMGQVLES